MWIITSQKQIALPIDSGIDTLNSFKNRGVKGGACRWYIKRVKQYTQAYPDQKLLTHTPELVTRFLEDEGRNTKQKDW